MSKRKTTVKKKEVDPIDTDKEELLRDVESKLQELEIARKEIESQRRKVATRISSSLIARRCLGVTDPKNVDHDEL
jgi:predicted DNA binding CopG/RHH family protein